MPQKFVPGVGTIDFPEGMTEDAIAAAIQQHTPQPPQGTEGGPAGSRYESIRNFLSHHDTAVPLTTGAAGGWFGPVGGAIGGALGGAAVHTARALDPNYPTEDLLNVGGDIAWDAANGAAEGGAIRGAKALVSAIPAAAAHLIPGPAGKLAQLAKILGLGSDEAGAAGVGGAATPPPSTPQASSSRTTTTGWPAPAGGAPAPEPPPQGPRPRVSREVPGTSYPSPLQKPINIVGDARQQLHADDISLMKDMLDKGYDAQTAAKIAGVPSDLAGGVRPTPPSTPPNVIPQHPQEADWLEFGRDSGRSNIKPRTSTQGQTFSVSRTPEEAISGLKAAGPPTGRTNPEPPSTVDDSGVKHGSRTPQTVDDLEGLSAAQQAAWEQFKRTNPGTSDSLLNSWLSSQPSQDPHAGMSLEEMGAKLADLVKRRR